MTIRPAKPLVRWRPQKGLSLYDPWLLYTASVQSRSAATQENTNFVLCALAQSGVSICVQNIAAIAYDISIMRTRVIGLHGVSCLCAGQYGSGFHFHPANSPRRSCITTPPIVSTISHGSDVITLAHVQSSNDHFWIAEAHYLSTPRPRIDRLSNKASRERDSTL